MNFEKRVSVFRGDVEESIHFGAAAVVSSSGELIHSIGNPDLITFPRSALKFIQAVALVESGAAEAYNLNERHLSLACASHKGEPIHIELVNKWLELLDLGEDNLACGTDYPLDKEASYQVLRANKNPSRIFHNCSGKHTAFLTVCRHLGYPVNGYHRLEHPVQQLFQENLSYFTDLDASKLPWQVDGCGFPAPALKLRDMAYAVSRFADADCLESSKTNAVKSLQQAIANHPEYMSGTNDLVAHVINATNGDILVKTGAEGFFIATIPKQNLGIAIKIADGSVRGVEFFLVSLLDELNLLNNQAKQKLASNLHPNILNSRREIVGHISNS